LQDNDELLEQFVSEEFSEAFEIIALLLYLVPVLGDDGRTDLEENVHIFLIKV
jgi:hypothetical protein